MPPVARVLRCAVDIPCDGPFDWPSMRAWLAARAVDGVEVVEADRYRRTAMVSGRPAIVDILVRTGGVRVVVHTEAAVDIDEAVTRARRLLDLDRDLDAMHRQLRHDDWMAGLLATHAGLRVPAGWDAFELAVRAVLGQQVTVSAGRQLVSQLVESCGTHLPDTLARPGLTRIFPATDRVAEADLGTVRAPGARRATLTALARSVAADAACLSPLGSLDEMVTRLRAVPGIGPWTAHYIALRALRHPDAFPASDAGLLRAAAAGLGGRPTPRVLEHRAEVWRPCRAYAAQLLWTSISSS